MTKPISPPPTFSTGLHASPPRVRGRCAVFSPPGTEARALFPPFLKKKEREIKRRSLVEAFPRVEQEKSSFREVSLSRQGERGTLPFPPLIDGTNRMWEQDGWVFSKVDDDDNGDEEDGFSITRETTHTNRGL